MERHNVLGDDAFQNETTRRLFNAIDELKSCGAGRDIDNLPEIVIVGDQSVGKSSLLQSLTEIPFAVAGKLCTRFPTRIVSRRSASEQTKVSIEPQFSSIFSFLEPDEKREAREARWARYSDFEALYPAFTAQDFASVVEKASQFMHVSDASPSKTEAGSEPLHNFSEDILKIEIQGPKRSHFAILDLPGNFQSLTGDLVERDMRLVKNMVLQHMGNEESIIVCVASAPTDLANQGVFDMAREKDPERTRTIGVVTKCDVTKEPTEIVEIVKNETKPLHHGWFVVRNRTSQEVTDGVSVQEHHQKELEFFRSEPWNSIPEERRGTVELKKYLSNRLSARYQSVFPSIRKEIQIRRNENEVALSKMGVTRETLATKRAYLSDIALAFHSLIFQSLLGQYASVTEDTMKLRMKVREANDTFTNVMKKKGHTVSFLETLPSERDEIDSAATFADKPDFPTAQVKEEVGGLFNWPVTSSVGFSCPTTVKFFVRYTEKTGYSSDIFQSINAMTPYSHFSFEELRLNDYTQNPMPLAAKEGKPSTAGVTNSSFGSGSLFSSQAPTISSTTTPKGHSPSRSHFGGFGVPANSNPGSTSSNTSASFGNNTGKPTATAKSQAIGTTNNSQSGSKGGILGVPFGSALGQKAAEAAGSLFGPKSAITRNDAEIYQWIQHEIRASRGTELQGTLNPSVLPVLFHKQAQKWRGLAEAHFLNVKDSADIAVAQILGMVCNDDFVKKKIQASIWDSSRKEQENHSKNLTEHLNNILSKHLQTNNDSFENKIQEARMRRFEAALRRYSRSSSYRSIVTRYKMNETLKNNDDRIVVDLWDTTALFAELHMSNQQNLEDEIHDILQAYYEIARENFIEFVNIHIIERYLYDNQGPVFAFSPTFIGKLTDEEVERLAAEDDNIVKRRADLKANLERLLKAEEIADRCIRTQVK